MYIATRRSPMRTTIEITDEQRAKLLQLAALRGEKGFSILVQEALDAYIEAQSEGRKKRQRALALMGVLKESEAHDLRKAAEAIRESWR
jgi:Arc/MetJ family transcription regulator